MQGCLSFFAFCTQKRTEGICKGEGYCNKGSFGVLLKNNNQMKAGDRDALTDYPSGYNENAG